MSRVDLPLVEGRRSSAAFGRSVTAAALGSAPPSALGSAPPSALGSASPAGLGSPSPAGQTDWRHGYIRYFRQLTCVDGAIAGLAAVHARMEFPAFGAPGDLPSDVVVGSGTPERELTADLLTQLPEVAGWLAAAEGPLVVGNYVYAPGVTHLKLTAAVDALGEHLRGQRGDVALAGLATPTDVFMVPPAAVEDSRARWRQRSRRSRAGALITGGRMLRPNYPDGSPPMNDSLVAQQGPNYALAKRIQRWRATVARREGLTVSFNIAPPTRTRSVTNNRLLAAAYAGAHIFGVEVFEPETANKLMAALLVHDLRNPRPAAPEAWEDEAIGAAHGGLWRVAYQPRTCLPLAAAVGLFRR